MTATQTRPRPLIPSFAFAKPGTFHQGTYLYYQSRKINIHCITIGNKIGGAVFMLKPVRVIFRDKERKQRLYLYYANTRGMQISDQCGFLLDRIYGE